jgi:hypothetical protein
MRRSTSPCGFPGCLSRPTSCLRVGSSINGVASGVSRISAPPTPGPLSRRGSLSGRQYRSAAAPGRNQHGQRSACGPPRPGPSRQCLPLVGDPAGRPSDGRARLMTA